MGQKQLQLILLVASVCSATLTGANGQVVDQTQYTALVSLGLWSSANQPPPAWPVNCSSLSSVGVACDDAGNVVSLIATGQTTESLSPTVSQLVALKTFSWVGGQLSRPLPSSFGSLALLQYVSFARNAISGTVPSTFGNLASLTHLDLSRNQLVGTLSAALTGLGKLQYLDVSSNKLSGSFPSAVFTLPRLQVLISERNSFNGSLPVPPSQSPVLSPLVVLQMGFNNFNGTLPVPWSLLTNLMVLDLSYNQLSGSLPSQYSSLKQLQFLGLNINKLQGSFPASWSSLTGMAVMSLSFNQLTGPLPLLSGLMSLNWIELRNNSFSGSIPASWTALTNLTALGLSSNRLSGQLPDSLSTLRKLQLVTLASNTFTGSIPDRWSTLTDITSIDLAFNTISGPVPSFLSRWSKLEKLRLRFNRLSGSIPLSLTALGSLTDLDFAYNQLSGPLPSPLSRLQRLVSLSLTANRFTGSLPATWSSLTGLQTLQVHRNPALSGTIPPQLGLLTALSTFNVQGTNLTCPAWSTPCAVPQSNTSQFCGTCTQFCDTCVATDSASPPPPSLAPTPGAVPSPTTPGDGAPTGYNPPSPAGLTEPQSAPVGLIVGASIGALAVLAAAIGAYIYCWKKRVHAKDATQPTPSTCTRYTLKQLQQATNDWSQASILGSGAFGTVYRGWDPANPSTQWAVKRAKLQSGEFRREVEAMSALRHPNLVRLLGYCSEHSPEREVVEQVLVYELVANGDLKSFMAQHEDANLAQRLDILLGIARGLEYLHSNGIIHRDVKPANILLDEKWQPKIADFGLLRALDGSTINVTQVVGTPGYVDPAYVRSQFATPSVDVYSFGVLMLQLLSRSSSGVGSREDVNVVHIKQWAEPLIEGGDVDAFKNPALTEPDAVVLSLARMALNCTSMPTSKRPGMLTVVAELEALRSALAGEGTGNGSRDRFAVKVDRHLGLRDESHYQASLEEEFEAISMASEPGSDARLISGENNGGVDHPYDMK